VTYEPERRWAAQRATGLVRPRVTYELTAIDTNTTELRFRFALGPLNGPGKLLWPVGKLGSPIVERATRQDLTRLAAQLEKRLSQRVAHRGHASRQRHAFALLKPLSSSGPTLQNC